MTPETTELAERRLLFALARFDSKISGVALVVSDKRGPASGFDKTCELSVTLRRWPAVQIESSHPEIAVCVSHVAGRAGRTVARAIERGRLSAGVVRRRVASPFNLKETR